MTEHSGEEKGLCPRRIERLSKTKSKRTERVEQTQNLSIGKKRKGKETKETVPITELIDKLIS
jgi:hypothetical protein